jgi:predicted amidophosphoribosyltransferase
MSSQSDQSDILNRCQKCTRDLPDAAKFCPACGYPTDGPTDEDRQLLSSVVFLAGATLAWLINRGGNRS